MKLLVSPTSVAEARVTLKSPVDVIDIKNPNEGSLGCQHPVVAGEMSRLARQAGREVSVAIGDMHHQPGTAAMAALGAAHLGADYVKAGLRGSTSIAQAVDLLQWMVETLTVAAADEMPNRSTARPRAVACGYADYQRFGGLAPEALIVAAAKAQCDYVMLDTLVKDGETLFDHIPLRQLYDFVAAVREQGMKVALAGSIQADHLPALVELQPDFIGVRGAICENSNRGTTICPHRTRAFVEAVMAATASAS